MIRVNEIKLVIILFSLNLFLISCSTLDNEFKSMICGKLIEDVEM